MAEPVRILELRSVLGTGGGPEKTILAGTALTDPGAYRITVCYIRDERDRVFHVDERAGALPIDYVEVRERHSLDHRIWRQLVDVVRRRKIDIVHAHDYKTDLLALLLAAGHPVIPLATAHGWAGHGWKERRVYYPADRRLLARFPRAIAVSSDIRDEILRAGGRASRVTVIPNGIDHIRFARDPGREAEARARLGLSAEDEVVGAVGRLEAEKNYPLLLRAAARLAPAHPRLAVLVGGDGSQRGALERLAQSLGVAARCRFLGHVRDVVELHHALDLFVMCSDNEGSPNAVLEAMAMETPVVATDVGGVSDLLTSGLEGRLVPRRDLDALARAMGEMLSDAAARRAMAAAARTKVERELSFDRRMRRVEAVYDELIAAYPGVRSGLKWYRTGTASRRT